MDTSTGNYAKDGQKSTEMPDMGGDVKSRVRRRNKKMKSQAGDTGDQKKGAGYVSKSAKKKYMGQLDEAGRI